MDDFVVYLGFATFILVMVLIFAKLLFHGIKVLEQNDD